MPQRFLNPDISILFKTLEGVINETTVKKRNAFNSLNFQLNQVRIPLRLSNLYWRM